ncbi:glycosyltransferase [Actinomadura graeca]|uniref:Glycosyltransferase n=1 Tax=Actinomadura graeca TaxID=2750812 RepID=A0ABX8QRW3_9ACTN|nr:glycosyltransferase [Actinomadura graeca]QXJ21546.1 glycosyltransferase [Actinomadura graeca]
MIVYFAGTPYDGVAGTDRQLADRLNALHPVLYVDPPVSLLTPLLRPHLAGAFRPGMRLRQEPSGVWRIRPRVLPGMYRPGMHHVTAALVRRAARRTGRRVARGAGDRVAAVVVATHTDLLDAVPGARRLLYVTDDLVAGAELIGLPRRRLAAARDRMAARADTVAVVSPLLRDQFEARGIDAELLPNGCAPEAYEGIGAAPWPDDVPRFDRPAAGFAGHINARIDLGLLEAVAGEGHPLVLIGPHDPGHHPARFRALVRRPNVCWTGRKSFAELPSYLGTIRVGLTPYLLDDFNRASFPIKTLDYLAAGRGVVSTDLPATRWLRAFPGGRELIRSESTPRGFLRAVGEELAAGPAPDLVARRREFAAGHDWSRRARSLAGLVDRDPLSCAQEEPAP